MGASTSSTRCAADGTGSSTRQPVPNNVRGCGRAAGSSSIPIRRWAAVSMLRPGTARSIRASGVTGTLSWRSRPTSAGSYAPTDYDELEASDLDLGSSSPVLLPRQPASTTPLMAVQGGKDAILRLVDRAHLGGVGHALQSIRLADQLFSAPAVWNDRSGTTWVFVGLRDGIYAYHLTTRGGKSRLVRGWHAALPTTRLGTSPIVDNGILFAAASGALVALDAANGRRLWSSDALGPIHWESPAVADGMVFCSDEDGDVTAFGL